MKVFFYFGRNPKNKSGVSWKIWKIEREGRELTTWWGAAVLKRRCPIPASRWQTASWTFRSEEAAADEERRRIREKYTRGYERKPRRR